jgi:ABC-2 type transport system permease protein
MVVVLPVVILVEAVGAGFGGVRMDAGSWIGLAVLLWVTAIPFAVLGVFVGFMATAETAYPIVTVLMFVLGYFGGLFQPVSRMPGFLQGLANVLPSERHATLGFNMLSGRSLGVTNLAVLAAYTAALSLVIVWKHRREEARGLA